MAAAQLINQQAKPEEDADEAKETPLPLAALMQCLAAVIQRVHTDKLNLLSAECIPALCMGLDAHQPWAVRLEAAKASRVLLDGLASRWRIVVCTKFL